MVGRKPGRMKKPVPVAVKPKAAVIVKDVEFKAITKSFIDKYGIKIIVDAGCNVMKDIPSLGLTNYYGMDIDATTQHKNSKLSRHGVSFHTCNVINDLLPQSDLIMCDCIDNFSDDEIVKAILNFKRSNARYLLLPSAIGNKKGINMPAPVEKVGTMSLWAVDDIPVKLAGKQKK